MFKKLAKLFSAGRNRKPKYLRALDDLRRKDILERSIIQSDAKSESTLVTFANEEEVITVINYML